MRTTFIQNGTPRSVLKLLVGSLCFAAACHETSEEVTPDAITANNLQQHVQFLAETTGVSTDAITYDETADLFFADGDMAITRTAIEEYLTGTDRTTTTTGRTEKTEQTRYTYLVNNSYVSTVKCYISEEVPTAWQAALRSALTQWDKIQGTRIHFTEVASSEEANIYVSTYYEDTDKVAYAYLPFANGTPGSAIMINTKYNGLIAATKLYTMVHELGHTVGFQHTDSAEDTHISSTPNTDTTSVMISTVSPWKGFSHFDHVASRVLYPGSYTGTNILYSGDQLEQGETIQSNDGRFTLIMQTDGNFVMYKNTIPKWATNTCCHPEINRITMEPGGNLVLSDTNNTVRWQSNTDNRPGAYLILQNDGNIVIYQSGFAKWASNTCCM